MPRKRSSSKSGKKRVASGPKPIPSGFRSVTPYLTITGAASAIDFYKKAFGAKEVTRDSTPDGRIMNAILRIGDSPIMLSDNMMGLQPQDSPVTIHLYSKDVDRLWSQAVGAGAKVTMPLDNQFWGERYGQMVDPFGHKWSLSMRVKMTSKEKKEKMDAAMKMMSQGGMGQGTSASQPPQTGM
jgi:PhnB protein